jgi:hypothetical protein
MYSVNLKEFTLVSDAKQTINLFTSKYVKYFKIHSMKKIFQKYNYTLRSLLIYSVLSVKDSGPHRLTEQIHLPLFSITATSPSMDNK